MNVRVSSVVLLALAFSTSACRKDNSAATAQFSAQDSSPKPLKVVGNALGVSYLKMLPRNSGPIPSTQRMRDAGEANKLCKLSAGDTFQLARGAELAFKDRHVFVPRSAFTSAAGPLPESSTDSDAREDSQTPDASVAQSAPVAPSASSVEIPACQSGSELEGWIYEPHIDAKSLPEYSVQGSQRAEALARDVLARTRGFDGKQCSNHASGVRNNWLRNCWSCVGGAITDRVGWFDIGGDSNPNAFVSRLRSRFGGGRALQDTVLTMGGRRWQVLTNRYKSNPGSAPRGSLVLCNTSAAGHSTVIIEPGRMARSDVTEVPADAACHAGNLHEILYPLD